MDGNDGDEARGARNAEAVQCNCIENKPQQHIERPRAFIIVMFSRLVCSCIFRSIYTSMKSREKMIK